MASPTLMDALTGQLSAEACVGVATCDTKSSDQLNLTPTSWNSLGPGLPPALPNHNNFFSHRRWWITSLFSKIHL